MKVPIWLGTVYEWATRPIFSVGRTSFSTANLLKLALFFFLLVRGTRILRRVLAERIFPRFHLAAGSSYALSNLIGYATLIVGMLVGLQTSGIDLSTLTVLFGAVGVGIGFGLQNIASNFVSGLIILLERPVQVGDRIQLGELNGEVVSINARATEILTNDEIAVIVPNSEFISQRVVNWSRGGDRIRIHVPVTVAYGSDLKLVTKALLEAAAAVDAVLRDPAPEVWLNGYGDSALNFALLGWTSALLHKRGVFVSQVNYAIHDALARHGVEIPFPRRDLRLREPIRVDLGESVVPVKREGVKLSP